MIDRQVVSPALRFATGIVILVMLRTIAISSMLSVEYLPTIVQGFDRKLVGFAGIAFGAVAASLSSFFLLWLMLGEARLLYRILFCALIDISAIHMAVSITRDLAVLDNGTTQRLVSIDTAGLYRLGMLAFYCGMGVLIKSFSSARMTSFTLHWGEDQGRHTTTLGHLMLMMALFAACFSSLRIVDSRVHGSDLWSALTVLALSELMPLFVITLPPMLATIGWRKRRVARAIEVSWCIALPLILMSAFLMFEPNARSALIQMSAFCAMMVLYRLLLSVMLVWAKRYGVILSSASNLQSNRFSHDHQARKINYVWPSAFLLALARLPNSI